MLNHVVLLGRLTRDPELRTTNSGVSVATFSVAVDRAYKDASGERGVDFIDIVAWRNTAEFAARYFQKGQLAAVEGRLQIRDWTDTDGHKRRAAEVVAQNIYFAGQKPQAQAGADHAGEFAPIDGDDGEELPF